MDEKRLRWSDEETLESSGQRASPRGQRPRPGHQESGPDTRGLVRTPGVWSGHQGSGPDTRGLVHQGSGPDTRGLVRTPGVWSGHQGSSDGRRKLASLSKASPDRTTWNILDDQPRAPPLAGSVRSAGSVDSQTGRRRDTGRTLAANFTANNRSNKGAVGNSVTTILHNNYSEKPLTPKSSNQRPTFNNLLKATGNDEASLEHGSVTKSQKNFASAAPPGVSPRPPPTAASPTGGGGPQGSPAPARRAEVTEQEAERFIQQVNQAAVTIQRWYRHHAARGRGGQAALRRLLAARKEVRPLLVVLSSSPAAVFQYPRYPYSLY
ncbi:unnamed protein product [Arctogadus glacialis]